MKYSDDCKVYRIRYYNVWFYLFAKTEMDEYKINILGERIGMGDSMMMKDIHCWCTRQNIRYLYQGSSHIRLSELTDPELVSDRVFEWIMTACVIRRHGSRVLREEERSIDRSKIGQHQ